MFHKTTTLTATAFVALLPFGAAHAVSEPLDIQLSYTVNTAGNLPAITNIITFNTYANTAIGSWFAAMVPANSLSYTIVDPFLKSSANAPQDGLMLGPGQGPAGRRGRRRRPCGGDDVPTRPRAPPRASPGARCSAPRWKQASSRHCTPTPAAGRGRRSSPTSTSSTALRRAKRAPASWARWRSRSMPGSRCPAWARTRWPPPASR